MSKSKEKADEIIKALRSDESVESIKNRLVSTPTEWFNYSAKAYSISLKQAIKDRNIAMKKPHVGATSNEIIEEILSVNDQLANYALSIPITSTISTLENFKSLLNGLPSTESDMLQLIGRITMNPMFRIRQKKGRLEVFPHFNNFVSIVDAASLSYYRKNYISCYLTLIPLIEGIIIRWMGYESGKPKPEFEEIRKFFKNSHKRQPCPGNILFHNIFVKVADKILNNHLYKPSTTGRAYSNFNRHVASHLLNDDPFATEENCIRLFMLLDLMTEIFLYESKINDPRFNLKDADLMREVNILIEVMYYSEQNSAEQKFLINE